MTLVSSSADQVKDLLQAGKLQEAEAAAQAALQREPEDVESLYILAVCQRYLKQNAEALETLSQLKIVKPDYGRTFQEEGHVRRQLSDMNAARMAYEQAVSLNPGLVASWKALGDVQSALGNEDAAGAAYDESQRLGALPPELLSVLSFIHEDKLLKAEQLCRAFLQKNKHHVEAMRLLADIGTRLHVLDDAEFLLESCLEFEPDNRRARMDYVNVLHRRQKYDRACDEAKRLHTSQPDNPAFETLYANECAAIGDFDSALTSYDAVLNKVPDNAHVHLVKGHALKTVGRQDDAVAAYRKAYEIKPDLGDAFWSLANLKTYAFSDPERVLMEAAESAPMTSIVDRFHLCFALGKAYEDEGDYETAFTFYERGNSLKKQHVRYDADRMDEEFQAQRDICTQALFDTKTGFGADSRAPIFIVGLPRAGSTLIEQILASHSQVTGTMELPNVPALAHRLGGRRTFNDERRYPGVLNDLAAEDAKKFGEAYIADTAVHHKGAPHFTDKMPNNFRHIGLIHLILPNAKIIDARRDPMACCFSGFKQLFAEGQEFTYGLDEIGRYYKGYVDLMNHWDTVLPGKILRVQYENVVDDLEAQVRRLLEFCGLPFEQACVDFHETDRSVRTASSEQVRQPIYTSGVEQWRNFEPFLGPLREALGPDLVKG